MQTAEFERVVNKGDAARMSRSELCSALSKGWAGGGPIRLELANVQPAYRPAEPTRTMPVNAVVRGMQGNGQIMCENTKKPLPPGSVVLIGPYADGPHGLCGTRQELMTTANGNAQEGPGGIFYTNLGSHIPYWFTMDDAQTFSDPSIQAFGVREDRRLADGSVLAKVVHLRSASDMAKFLSDPTRLLKRAEEPPTQLRQPAPQWAQAGQGTTRHQPFIIDPRGQEGQVCVNDISWITQESWAEEEDQDRVAIYMEGQKINPGVQDKLKAYCFTRANLVQSMEMTKVYRWSQGRAMTDYPLYKMPYPAYFLDEKARRALDDPNLHSYVMKFVEEAPVGTRVGMGTLHGAKERIYTLIPIRNEVDVAREFMS